jgi:fibronectin-binding autotransporter adhesin
MMKISIISFAFGGLLGLALMHAGDVSAGTIYYDTNAATAGTGSGASDWNSSSTNWTTDPTGSSATVAWASSGAGNLDGSDVVFSAGTNAPATYSINQGGNKISNSLTVDQGAITLTTLGGSAASRTIGAGGITLQTEQGATNPVGPLNFNSPSSTGTQSIVLSASQTWTNNSSATTAVSFNANTGHAVMTVNGNATTGNTTTLALAGSATGAYNFAVAVGDGAGGGKLAISTGQTTNFTNIVSPFSGGLTITGATTTLDNGGGLGHSNISITGGTLAGGITGSGGSLTDNIANDSGELISLSGSGVLDLTNLHFNLNVTGTQTQAEYVLANADVGSPNVTGTAFAGVNLPAGWSIDYDGTAANPGDIVLVAAAVPEPTSLLMAALGGLSIAAAWTRRRKSVV